MNHFGPRSATTTPKTLEKQREVMEALRALAAQDDEQFRRRRADIAALRRELEGLRRDCGLLAQTLPRMCCDQAMAVSRVHFRKYNPDQPRVPAGNPDGGEWTSEGNGTGPTSPDNVRLDDPSDSAAARSDDIPEPGPQYAALETETQTDETAGGAGVQVAAGPGRPGYPIELRDDEGFGHTIRYHVRKSEDYLLSVVRTTIERAERLGDSAGGLKEWSFSSLEAANKLVNSIVSENQNTVDLVAAGLLPGAQLDADFPSPTGYEVFARTERSAAHIRPTYGVHVVIVRDRDSPRGYRVYTAFPVNR